MGVSGSSQTKQAQSPASGGSLSLTTHHFYLVVLQTLLLSLLCQRHTVEGCSVTLRQLCPIIPQDETQEPSVFIAFEVAPAGCEVTQLLINIIGSRGRSNVIRRMASPGEMQYEEFISLEQLPDRRGTYTFSVQALGLDGNSSQSSAKVVISYVYGCQKTFSNSSPDWCIINCRFACETPQLQRYSLTVFDTQGQQQDSVTTSLRRNIRIPCDLEVVEIETQGLDRDGNELRLPSVITEGPESTLGTSSNEAEPTSSLTTPNSTPSEIPGNSLTTASTSSASETATSSLPVEVRAGLDQDTLIIVILASLLGGVVLLFLLAAIIVCLWLVKKQKVQICKSGRGDTTDSGTVLQPPPVMNTYYDSVRHSSSRSTSAVYDTVRRGGGGPEILVTSSQGTITDANGSSSLQPLQAPSNNIYESPYDDTTMPKALEVPNDTDPLPDSRVPSPFYSYVQNSNRVELVQHQDGAPQHSWLAVVRSGRRSVQSWTGSEHVYI